MLMYLKIVIWKINVNKNYNAVAKNDSAAHFAPR